MKSISTKKMLLTLGLISTQSLLWAGDGSQGVQIGDTMIFSLFVVTAVIFMMIIYAMINALKGILENKELWTEKSGGNKGGGKAAAVIGMLFLSQGTFAQGGAVEPLVTMTNEMYWIMIGLNMFLLGIILTLYYVIRGMIKSLKGEEEEEVNAISQITASLTDAIPIEREGEIMLDHDYDGIRELDNNLPPWWKYGFYFTIIFAVAYLIHYHVVGSGDLQIEEYNKEMAQAEIEIEAFKATQENLVDESNLQALTDGARIEAGKKVFMDNCKVCHGEFGEGMVGPNFTDKYWKHGGGIKNIYYTIKVGVPDKGMISWENQLSAAQILEVSSYILTLEGTNPPNQKAAEGDLWEGDAPSQTDAVEPEASDEDEVTEVTEGDAEKV